MEARIQIILKRIIGYTEVESALCTIDLGADVAEEMQRDIFAQLRANMGANQARIEREAESKRVPVAETA